MEKTPTTGEVTEEVHFTIDEYVGLKWMLNNTDKLSANCMKTLKLAVSINEEDGINEAVKNLHRQG